MKSRNIRVVAFLTTLTILLGCCTFGSASATHINSIGVTPSTNIVTIVKEDISLRQEYEKHFLMSDGSYTVAVYNEPVHQKVNETWVEIDNTLQAKTSQNGEERYETVQGIADVSFAKSYQDKLVVMTQDEYSISWGIEANTSRSQMTTTNIAQQPRELEVISKNIFKASTEEEQKILAEKTSSIVQYNNALLPQVDLEYTVLPSRVKESVVLNSPQDISSYTVNVSTKNLSARLLTNKEIEFFDKKNTVIFTMWAPYMYDSAAELSEDIDVALQNVGNGQYNIIITPDSNWLNDPERVYPVTIDPDVSVSRVRQNIIDTYVWEGHGNQNENLDRMYIGNKSGYIARAYIKYVTMPTIPSGATITGATQRVNILSGTSTANNAAAYKVTGGNWDSGTITWANKPYAGTVIATNISHNNKSYYSFSCTSTVQSWYSGSPSGKNANYGIMIRYNNESINDYNSFYSSDYATESKRPLMVISYTTAPQQSGGIVWPVPGHYTINSKWGYRNFDGTVHRGIDINCNGANVVAAISGSVRTFYDSSSGNSMVVTKTGSSFQTRYYHLKSYKVTSGSVSAGTIIAVSGSSGNVTGPHLHFQLQWGDDKYKSYNPLPSYHSNDRRSTWTNPNPMFKLSGSSYVPNPYFNYSYTPSDYNSTSTSWGN